MAYVKANSHDKAYAEFSDKENKAWHNQDLYLVVWAGRHGAGAWRQRQDDWQEPHRTQDVDGKAFVKERVDLAKTNASFWQDYKFTNPENKKIEPKSMYCERLDDSVVCGGIYNDVDPLRSLA